MQHIGHVKHAIQPTGAARHSCRCCNFTSRHRDWVPTGAYVGDSENRRSSNRWDLICGTGSVSWWACTCDGSRLHQLSHNCQWGHTLSSIDPNAGSKLEMVFTGVARLATLSSAHVITCHVSDWRQMQVSHLSPVLHLNTNRLDPCYNPRQSVKQGRWWQPMTAKTGSLAWCISGDLNSW